MTINIDERLPDWVRLVSALIAREDQSLGALALAGFDKSLVDAALGSGYVRRYHLVGSGSAVFRSTIKGRKTLQSLRSRRPVVYSLAAAPVKREPVEFEPYTPEKWVNPRPESADAFNISSRGLI